MPAPQNSILPKAGLIPVEPRCQSSPRWVLGSVPASTQHSHLGRRRRTGPGGPRCHGHRPVYHGRAELISRISRVIVAYRKQNKGNYYSSLVGGPWLISLCRAARRQGNLTVLIKRSAAAQSNYGETVGLCWGLGPSWGQAGLSPAVLTGSPLPRQGGCSSSPPSAFSHVSVAAWSAKTFSRSKANFRAVGLIPPQAP